MTKTLGSYFERVGVKVFAPAITITMVSSIYLSLIGVPNRLYRNIAGKRFELVTENAGLRQDRVRYNTGCAFLDYDRDGHLDLFVANYLKFDYASTPKPGRIHIAITGILRCMRSARAAVRSQSALSQ